MTRSVGLGFIVALLVVGTCTGIALAKDQVVIAQGVDPPAVDPMLSQLTPTWNVTSAIFDTLLDWDASGKLAPALAESYQLVNPTTWEFKLRRNVRFQNGEAFNAAAVAFSIDRLNNSPKSKNAYMKAVKTVEIVDDYTVRLITHRPDPILDKQLFSAAMFPPKYIAQVGDDEFAKKPIGTGPYRLVKWIKDDQLVLEAFKEHWRGPAKIRTVIFRGIPDDSTRVASLRTGEVDLIVNVPPHVAEELKRMPGLKVHTAPSVRTIFVTVNALAPSPLQDVRVRRAANMAVDVERMTRTILGGYARVLQSELSPLIFGFDAGIKRFPYDPAQAKRLLAEAGYPNGFDTVLNTPSGRYLKDREVAEAVAGFLSAVGIRAKVQPHEFGKLVQTLYARRMPGLTLMGWGLPARDADVWLKFSLHSKGKLNYYENPALDRLVELGGSEMDPNRRLGAYREALQIAHDQAVHIPLYYGEDIYASKADLNFTPRSDEHIVVHELSFGR